MLTPEPWASVSEGALASANARTASPHADPGYRRNVLEMLRRRISLPKAERRWFFR